MVSVFGLSGLFAGVGWLALFVVGFVDRLGSLSRFLLVLAGFWRFATRLRGVVLVGRRFVRAISALSNRNKPCLLAVLLCRLGVGSRCRTLVLSGRFSGLAVVVLVGFSGACCAQFGLLGWGGRFQGLGVAARLAAAMFRQRGRGWRRFRFRFFPQPPKMFLDSWYAWGYLAFVVFGTQLKTAD